MDNVRRRAEALYSIEKWEPASGRRSYPAYTWQTPYPHSSKLRLHRRSTPGAFLITKCLQPRLGLIDSPIAAEICSTLCFYVNKGQIHLVAFVVMLDHWHAVVAAADGKNISERMNIIDSWIGKQTVAALDALGCDWQQGFNDTEIRSAKQFEFVCVYVEENPVRMGLVNSLRIGGGLRQIRNTTAA